MGVRAQQFDSTPGGRAAKKAAEAAARERSAPRNKTDNDGMKVRQPFATYIARDRPFKNYLIVSILDLVL